jgi:hypothetical protein
MGKRSAVPHRDEELAALTPDALAGGDRALPDPPEHRRQRQGGEAVAQAAPLARERPGQGGGLGAPLQSAGASC